MEEIPIKKCLYKDKDKDKDKDLFIDPQEFVVGYSKAPEQPQSSARPICHSHTMTRTGREPATIRTAAYGARRATHCATGDDSKYTSKTHEYSIKRTQ